MTEGLGEGGVFSLVDFIRTIQTKSGDLLEKWSLVQITSASTSAAPNQNTEANIKALPKAQFRRLILLIDYKNDCHQ